jgi:hypothetical protein
MYDTENPEPFSKALSDSRDLRYFACDHLPPHLREVSSAFRTLALDLVHRLPECDQRKLALQYLLIAKDAAVRAALSKD